MTTVKERAQLAMQLLYSLEEVEPEPDHEGAWFKEIERRDQEIVSGKVKGVPWSEIEKRYQPI